MVHTFPENSSHSLVMAQDIGEELKAFRRKINLTQEELADKLNIKRSRYAQYESGRNFPPLTVLTMLYSLGYRAEVGHPLIPAPELEIPIVSIGYVSASTKINWTDPFEVEEMEYVPGHMGDGRGRFACKVESDCMVPLLEPDDVCIFQRSDIPKIGCVSLFRSNENKVTIKQIRHDGKAFILHPLNPAYQDEPAEGMSVGYLVGVIRRVGKRTRTDYDPDGIRPGTFT